jgi:Flp pilus assembly secretin CpaC
VQVQLDVVLAEVRPGLTHTFISGLRKPTANPVPGPGQRQPANVFFNVLESPHDTRALHGFLSPLRQGGLAKVLAEPRLMTLSGRPASFLTGGEQAVPTSPGLGQVGVQFEEFGTRLNFLPIVLGNGKVHLEVEPEVSRLDPASGVSIDGKMVPGRITDRVNTSIELATGQTFLIGGLTQQAEAPTAKLVPVLGQLPLVGPLFRTPAPRREEMEFVVLVTPTVINPADPKRHGKADGEGPAPNARASLRRLERQLKHVQQEVEALHRQLRSPHATEPAASGGW